MIKILSGALSKLTKFISDDCDRIDICYRSKLNIAGSHGSITINEEKVCWSQFLWRCEADLSEGKLGDSLTSSKSVITNIY